jgi:hypothetical protein
MGGALEKQKHKHGARCRAARAFSGSRGEVGKSPDDVMLCVVCDKEATKSKCNRAHRRAAHARKREREASALSSGQSCSERAGAPSPLPPRRRGSHSARATKGLTKEEKGRAWAPHIACGEVEVERERPPPPRRRRARCDIGVCACERGAAHRNEGI